MESMNGDAKNRPTEIIWAFKCTLNEELSRLSKIHLLRFDTETRGIDWFGARDETGSHTSSEAGSTESGESSRTGVTGDASYAKTIKCFQLPSDMILDKENCGTLDEAIARSTDEALAVADASDWEYDMTEKVYSRQSRPGHGTREFKSTKDIPGRSPKYISEFLITNRKRDDVQRGLKNRHKYSANTHKSGAQHRIKEYEIKCEDGNRGNVFIVYRVIDLPWPVSNRDMVYLTYWKTVSSP